MITRILSCPRCGNNAPWNSANPYRPFCSERCKMLDLGAWASESYRIPIAEAKDAPEIDGTANNDD